MALDDARRRRLAPGASIDQTSLVEDFWRRGGTVWACPPCVKARGHAQDDFIDGVTVQGASAMRERLEAGAASLSF